MSLSNNKITAPVSVDDVADCLGMTRSSTLADLCTSSKINVWAKYKPTVFLSPFPDDWYKAKDGNYGINITVGTMNAGETKTVRFTNLTSGKSYKIYVIANGVWVAKGLLPSAVLPLICSRYKKKCNYIKNKKEI